MRIEQEDFLRLKTYMQDHFGINLDKKQTLVEGRLANTLTQAGYTSFYDYIEDVMRDKTGEKIALLTTKLTTNYSYFMREQAHYEFMTRVALPFWKERIRDKDLRIWSAGCSSGEEAYTTAMVLKEYFGREKSAWDSTILATDISARVLSEAKAAVYPLQRLEKLPPEWQRKYFTPAGPDMVQVKPELQKEVVFGHFNLMDEFTRFKKKFHIIFCRNVMIYFDFATKEALANRFYHALEPGGFLFVGLSESITGMKTPFQQVGSAIYRKSL